MKKFFSYMTLFLLLPVLVGLGWTIFVVVMDARSYMRALAAPEGTTVAVCGDSQTKDALDPALFPGLFNFSTAATTCDQDLLRLSDLLSRNRGRLRHVLLDVSPLKVGYSTEKPVSELNSSRVHALLYFYHLFEKRRELGSVGALWRDVVCTRKYNEFRKAILRGKPWRSSMAGAFDPEKEQGFLNPKFRARALEDVLEKAERVNRRPPVDLEAPLFGALAESAGLVRAAGAVPVFTTMPLSRQLRSAIEPDRLAAFTAAVRDLATRLDVDYLDYLSYDLPDSCWHDGNHLNRAGAEMFTRRFAADFAPCARRRLGVSRAAYAAECLGVFADLPPPVARSGLAHGAGDVYWVARDASGGLDELEIVFDAGTGRVAGCKVLRQFELPGISDVEGVAYDPLRRSVWVCDEAQNVIAEFSPETKRRGAQVVLPRELLGVRKGHGLEALEISADGLDMWICNENELPIDDRASPGSSEFVRLTRFSRRSAEQAWHVSGQWAYRPESAADVKKLHSRNGVPSLCLLPGGELLVLECGHAEEGASKFLIRVYCVDRAGATDVRGWTSLADADFVPVRKRLVFETADSPVSYEGICCGPAGADGSATLLLVSDARGKGAGQLMSLRLARRP